MEENVKLIFTSVNKTAATFRSIEGQIDQIRGRVLNLQTVMLTTFGGITLAKMTDDFLSVARLLENLELRMNAAAGSTEAGNKAFEEAASIAKNVSYEYEDIISSAVNLRGVLSRDPENFKMYMQMITDIAAYTQLSIEETTSNFIRTYNSGIGSAELFRDRGLKALAGFRDGVAYTGEESVRILVSAWEKAGSKFRDLSKDLSGNIDGMWSMILDRYFDYRKKVMDTGPKDMVKAALQEVLDITGELDRNGTLDEWAEASGYNIVMVAQTATMSIAQVIDFVRTNTDTFENGIIGYLLYGKKGALIALGLDQVGIDIQQAISNAMAQVDAYQKGYLSLPEMIFDVSNKSISEKLAERGYFWDQAGGMDDLGLGDIRTELKDTIDEISELEDYLNKTPWERFKAKFSPFESTPEGSTESLKNKLTELTAKRNELQKAYYEIVQTGINPDLVDIDTDPQETLVADKVAGMWDRILDRIKAKKVQPKTDTVTPPASTDSVIDDKQQLKIDEERLSYYIKKAEAIKDVTTSLTAQLTLNKQLLTVEQKKLDEINQTTDPDKYYKQLAAIDEVKAKVAELTLALKDQSLTLKDGLLKGFGDYTQSIRSEFDQMVKLAGDTAKGMESSFSDFYFDAMRGELNSLGDYFTSFAISVQRSIAQILAQTTAAGITGYFTSSTPAETTPQFNDGLWSGYNQGRASINPRYLPDTTAQSPDSRSVPFSGRQDVSLNLVNETGRSMKISNPEISFDFNKMVINAFLQDVEQDGTMTRTIKGLR